MDKKQLKNKAENQKKGVDTLMLAAEVVKLRRQVASLRREVAKCQNDQKEFAGAILTIASRYSYKS